jgi:hypothetical protein
LSPEIRQRLRIGFALLVGFGLGKLASRFGGMHSSEGFVAGFAAGVVATQWVFHRLELRARRKRSL